MVYRALALSLLLLSCRDPHLVRTCYGTCGSGVGECRSGFQACNDDGGVTCIGAIGPSAEVCDGLDNNCDGEIDNHTIDSYGSCSAECEPGGVVVCDRGALACIPIQNPQPETCDDKDNDCDGVVDNIVWDGGLYCYTGPPGTAGNGSCHPGTWRCRDRHVDCAGQALPSVEACNGVDDDCDGMIDDGISCNTAKDLHIEVDWNFSNDVDTHLRNANAAPGTPTTRSGWANLWDCYYGNVHPNWSMDSNENPNLAYDDLYGPGPEHLRIAKMATDAGYDIGIHLFSWKSAPTFAYPTVKIYCGGNHVATRIRVLQNNDFWYVGRIQYTEADPCHYEDAADGGPIF